MFKALGWTWRRKNGFLPLTVSSVFGGEVRSLNIGRLGYENHGKAKRWVGVCTEANSLKSGNNHPTHRYQPKAKGQTKQGFEEPTRRTQEEGRQI